MLIGCGIDDAALRAELMQAAEHILNTATDYLRWPTIPLRCTAPNVTALLDSPETSFWLRDAFRTALERDPVDAVRDANILAAILTERCHNMFNRKL